MTPGYVSEAVVQGVTFRELCVGGGILCTYFDDVIRDGASSSNLHNLISLGANISKIVAGIRDRGASGTACPLLWFVLVVFFH